MEQINQLVLHIRANKEASLISLFSYCSIRPFTAVLSNINFVSARANLCLITWNSFKIINTAENRIVIE